MSLTGTERAGPAGRRTRPQRSTSSGTASTSARPGCGITADGSAAFSCTRSGARSTGS